jgi:hypothetical protein
MAQIIDDTITYCPKCRKFISYNKGDIKKGEHIYYVYGCEENYAPYKYIECPKCHREIELHKDQIKLTTTKK